MPGYKHKKIREYRWFRCPDCKEVKMFAHHAVLDGRQVCYRCWYKAQNFRPLRRYETPEE